MALFMIRRQLAGYTEDELDAAMFRSMVCVKAFPGMRWVRSYGNEKSEESMCLYEAQSLEDVWAFTRMAHVQVDDIWEVSEVNPDVYWSGREEREPALAS